MSKMHNNPSHIIPESALFCNDSKPAYFVHMTEQAGLFPVMMEQAPLFHSYDDGEMEPRYHTLKHDMGNRVSNKKAHREFYIPAGSVHQYLIHGKGIKLSEVMQIYVDDSHTDPFHPISLRASFIILVRSADTP